MRYRLIAGLICLISVISGVLAPPATAVSTPAPPSTGLRISTDIGAMVRVNSTARLLAGLAPSYPNHFPIADTQAWKDHSVAMRTAWAQVGSSRVSTMSSWRDTAISSTCPAGKTLLYPFSGPDFFNAYWLFPDCEN